MFNLLLDLITFSQLLLDFFNRVRLSQGGSLSIDQDSDSDDLFEDMSTESGYRRFGCNPWSMHCHRQQIAKMQKTPNGADDQSHSILSVNAISCFIQRPRL